MRKLFDVSTEYFRLPLNYGTATIHFVLFPNTCNNGTAIVFSDCSMKCSKHKHQLLIILRCMPTTDMKSVTCATTLYTTFKRVQLNSRYTQVMQHEARIRAEFTSIIAKRHQEMIDTLGTRHVTVELYCITDRNNNFFPQIYVKEKKCLD